MPPRKKKPATAPPALTDADVTALRTKVGAGEKPRVIVRAASAAVPAGTRGNVVRIGNPSEGEFIVVRLGRDEVPFAPSELALTTRSAPPAPLSPSARTTAKSAPAPTTARAPAAARTPTPPRTPAAARTPTPARAAAPSKASTPARKAATRTSGRGARKAPPPLTVTLRFGEGAWTVEAQRGARRLARASALRPGAVKAFAEHVDEPAVREALTETVDSCRAVVEERAQKLRAELHDAEATLKEYEARRR